ncbi:serine protease family protein [Pseudoalteromonas fuliginea]|uniref:Serine protease n=1 Tax=Pseudoalteromonas fuliginea TaxID=1872678 RepID=A0ABQ6RK90_9GAMM|nr:trypsin-like peptidase domain-containing protein [Pseudoalteromonas fuliginea]KAA1160324.1 hypothetical protein EU509_06045 [Pseudoalteromonas fuliginea]KAA1168744.1 hypothetical protein EUZ79_04060 [Pseudoalteromonas fuliginea]
MKFLDKFFGLDKVPRDENLRERFINLETLKHKAVKLDVLNELNSDIPATGFIFKDGSKYYLYTCWHIVSKSGLYQLKYEYNSKERYGLRVTCSAQNCSESGQPTFTCGKYEFEVPLYNEDGNPLWMQDIAAQDDINFLGAHLNAPYLHDCISIDITNIIDLEKINPFVFLERSDIYPATVFNFSLGQDSYIVGFPYGYSANVEVPIPVTLKRAIASKEAEGLPMDFLLDGDCAAGMSGSPVFMQAEDKLRLVGIYTGSRYTLVGNVEPFLQTHTSLGTACLLSSHFYTKKTMGHVIYQDQIIKDANDWKRIYGNFTSPELIKEREDVFGEKET